MNIRGPQGPQGDDYVLTAQDKADIAAEVNVPVTDVQVNGTSVLSGGVANVPVASPSDFGVIKVKVGDNGLNVVSGFLVTYPANSSDIKKGTQTFRQPSVARQHESTFYGLAKAAGDTTQSESNNAVGTYTETARSKIHEMLDAPVTVSGTDPVITAKAGVRYVCGTVDTLTLTLPASGVFEVWFTSGTTPTVLSAPGVTMPDWWIGVEANRVYDIIITDGYGVVTSWSA